jgi:hypothetical protein
MKVAVPSAQHSKMLGALEPEVPLSDPHRRPQPVGLAVAEGDPLRHPRLGQATPESQRRLHGTRAGRRARALPTAERGQVGGGVAPHDVLALDRPAGAPPLGGEAGDHVDHLPHRGVDALLGQRGHAFVGDPARDDVAEVGHVRRDVEGEAVHRPAPIEADPDRRDLAGRGAVDVDPDTGVPVEP